MPRLAPLEREWDELEDAMSRERCDLSEQTQSLPPEAGPNPQGESERRSLEFFECIGHRLTVGDVPWPISQNSPHDCNLRWRLIPFRATRYELFYGFCKTSYFVLNPCWWICTGYTALGLWSARHVLSTSRTRSIFACGTMDEWFRSVEIALRMLCRNFTNSRQLRACRP
ncbi:hypothetical protein CLAIMM_09833 [Cladophialophora immunda]|nr:hypothetical protein CLAIMM_09833 [Cladophialophora immunda]